MEQFKTCRKAGLELSFFLMSEFGKKPDILVTEDFKVYEIIGEEAKQQLELLKNEVENISRKIQIILRLPRIFRDAITLEEKFQ